MKRRFDEKILEILRNKPLTWAMDHVGFMVHEDRTFTPFKDKRTKLYYVSRGFENYEILVTGPKWIDKRNTEKSGGGCIDLVMYLCKTDFVGAVNRLIGSAE